MNAKTACFRRRGYNPNHNIWDNNGTWFFHRQFHPTRITKERVRCSLKTKNVKEARLRRDKLLRRLENSSRPSRLPVTLMAT